MTFLDMGKMIFLDMGKCFVIFNLLLSLMFLGFAVAAQSVRIELHNQEREVDDRVSKLQERQTRLQEGSEVDGARVEIGVDQLSALLKKKNDSLIFEKGRFDNLVKRKNAENLDLEKEKKIAHDRDVALRENQIQKDMKLLNGLQQDIENREERRVGLIRNRDQNLDKKNAIFNEITQQENGLDDLIVRNRGLRERLRELGGLVKEEPMP